ncbi:tyrosine-protein kinase Fer isoform X1 [Neocloeon triangulifer]|uniref:tyrosine-protein kinase Fer isoform X1 n=1 Tax=Neocloeon triangulifer TaxID=2078957 RepID=UPI00286F1112|nr:tyrosine-protein kinase Fer isoform X1 [Neocloeon triangulifer]
MGFSTALQGQGAHEVLLQRQDAELRLLDTMRRCLASKLKCDRDFAQGVAGVAAQATKRDWNDELQDSNLAKAWCGFATGLSDLAREVREGAENLENKALQALKGLHESRRDARKTYHEEHLKIIQRLSSLSEAVQRKRNEYQKQLEVYKTTRSRFEEQYVNSGRTGPKLAEVMDKYQRACRRLHLIHNEYVLLLNEASNYEKDFRTSLLPGLLELQQNQQETALTTLKRILAEIVKYTNLSSEKFAEIYTRMSFGVRDIKPKEEYQKFAEKHKTDPKSQQKFVFDESLTEDSSGKLQPNVIAVDNLTLDWLKAKIAELENEQKDLQSKLKDKEETLARSKQLNGQSDPFRVENSSAETLAKQEIELLKCDDRQKVLQLTMIKNPLNEIGCEEIPPGCDLSLVQTESRSTVTMATDTLSMVQTRQNRFQKLFKKPFSGGKKSHSVSQTTLTNISMPGSPKESSRGSSLVEMTDPLQVRSSLESEYLSDGQASSDDDDSEGSLPSNPEPLVFRNNMTISKPVLFSSTNKLHEHIFEFNNKPAVKIDGVPGTKGLGEQEWFHGVLPREEVVRLLKKEGDFLVRETMRNEERQIVLSVSWGSSHKHFIVQNSADGMVRFEGPAFNSVPELVVYQLQSSLPVTARSQVILKNPVPKETWELNNDDVMLLEKIGRGNFGDVYKAKLRKSGQDVAVKTCRVTLPDEHRRKFLQEGRILKQYDHPNIVKLVGICVQKQPIMIVMELVPGGSLLTYLRNNANKISCRQLLAMCKDAASGMKYLESKNCIHRDLAARNCLIGLENIVKISDFGMSREEEEYIVSDGMKQIPIKWTAPEALNYGKYTTLCDVWSYGVLAWEIFAKGGVPYNGMSNSQARERIDEGYRMPAPEGTPPEMYQIMLKCWAYESENRPKFDEIFRVVNQLHEASRQTAII